jgi:hypothetical protein
VAAHTDDWANGSITGPGTGLIVVGMTHQGWDPQLTACSGRDGRANFFPVGIAHSIVGGSAWERTPWRGGAAGGVEAMRKASRARDRVEARLDPGLVGVFPTIAGDTF